MFSDSAKTTQQASAGEVLSRKIKTTRLTLEVDPKRHKAVRRAAVAEDCYIRDIVIQALDEWLKNHGYDK